MKIKHITKTRKPLYIVLLVVFILLLLGVAAYFLFWQKKDNSTYTPEYPVSSTNTTPEKVDSTNTTPASTNDTTVNEDIPVSSSGSISIVNLNQKNGYVNALAQVTNFSPSQCVYTFASPGSKPVVREQNGDCSGVSISQDEFDKIGTYTLTVSVYEGDKKLTATKDIDVQ